MKPWTASRGLYPSAVLTCAIAFVGCAPETVSSTPVPSAQEPERDTLAMEPFGTTPTIDVVTWNIETFPKNGETTIETVRQMVEAMDVDLIGLQEISDRGAFETLVDQLPGWEGHTDSAWYAGLAWLYRTDRVEVVRQYEIYTTEEYWSAFPRSPQVMKFRSSGTDIVVINNHLKCCGDGVFDAGNAGDEETRRAEAMRLLKDYVDEHFDGQRVVILGDLNDSLTDAPSDNVFQPLLDEPERYRFVDLDIAQGDSEDWSFPNWPSHLDHLLITQPLFANFEAGGEQAETILVDQALVGGWWVYDRDVSDHRPVGLRLAPD